MPYRVPKGVDGEAYINGIILKAGNGERPIMPAASWSSLLPYTFNLLWTGALNMRKSVPFTQNDGTKADLPISYFAMIHDDVMPSANWLNVLIDELESTGADIVSAVIPIKDEKGLTSTATDTTGDLWSPRRLTLHEVFQMPETFGDEDAGGELLLNTGLWVCRFDAPWVEKVHFRQQDQVVKMPDGNMVPRTISEDWDFSRQVRRHGGKLMATRKVKVVHEAAQWHNHYPWGKWEIDQDLLEPVAEPQEDAGGERGHHNERSVLHADAAA